MPDAKLSANPQGTVCSQYYGISAGLVSQKFFDQGIFNVKNYGAQGIGAGHDDTAGIQAALNAAYTNLGGIVFFPPGFYHITSSLTEPANARYNIKLLGSGSAGGQTSWGSVIQGSFNDYLLKTVHPHPGTNILDVCTIGSIENLGFRNDNTSTVDLTSCESGSTGSGCVYLSGDLNLSVRNCTFVVNTGIGFAHVGQNLCIDGCGFSGPYSPSGAHFGRSVGAFVMNGRVQNTNFSGIGTGVISVGTSTNGGSNFSADKIDTQTCGVALMLGHTTLSYWDLINNVVIPAGDSLLQYGHISNHSAESCGGSFDASNPFNAFVYCGQIGSLTLEHCFWGAFNQIGTASYAVYISSASNCYFRQLGLQGTYSAFTMYLGHVFACMFSNIQNPGGVTTWHLPSSVGNNFGVGEDSNSFQYCTGTDGGTTINGSTYNYFPLCPTAQGQTQVCTDSALALSGTNLGAYISAVSTTTAATAAGNNTLTFASGHVPAQVANGWQVWDVTTQNGLPLGTVNTKTATTVVMNAGSNAAVANGDVVAFTNGGGTNKVTVRWNGDKVAGTGGWYIVG